MGISTLTSANDDSVNTTTDANSLAKTVMFSLPETVMPNMWLTDYDSLFYNDMDGYWGAARRSAIAGQPHPAQRTARRHCAKPGEHGNGAV